MTRKLLSIFVALMMMFSIVVIPASALVSTKDYDVPENTAIVLFTNDVHCGIEDGWGYAGVAALKKQYEAEGYTVILVDAGDHIQGGPIGTLSKGQYIIDIMNYVGYDFAVPGNHEFDYTMDQFFNLVDSANYPYCSANFMNYVDGEPTDPVLDAYKIFEVGSIKIAFVGLSTPETLVKSTPTYFMNDAGEYIYGFCQDETGEGVYTACQNAIDAARADGADFVVVVGHMGIDEQSAPWRSTDVIANISGCDAFIDGHSHSVVSECLFDKVGDPVLLYQTGTKLANVGKLTIAPHTFVGEVMSVPSDLERDPDTVDYIDGIKAQYEDLLNTEVAYTPFDLTVNDPETGARIVRKQETNLGDLCADAYLNLFDVFGADIAFVNGGGVRANIVEGPITFGQILNVHPFGNSACLVEVTGQQILDALEMGSRNCPSENGGFLQVAGITYEIHTSLEPNVVLGSDGMWTGTAGVPYRVQNVQVMNRETGAYEPLDLTKTYRLASHNYMLKNCGDGYGMFGVNNVTLLADEVMLDNAVLINYIQSMPSETIDGVEYEHVVTDEYADPYGQGRIVIVPEEPEPVGTVILFTNDVHCGIEDGWGYAGVAAMKKQYEAEGYDVILVDAGDHVQGGPIGTLSNGMYIIDIMNYVGYDLAVPGNHEYDYTMPQFFNIVDAANYPYISANFMNYENGEPTTPVLDAYTMFESAGVKIAFVGLSTPETLVKSTPTYFQNAEGEYIYGFCQDETGEGVYTACQNAVDAARAAGADYVIVLGHMGIDDQSEPWRSTDVIANITGVDAFIDGHSHSVVDNTVPDLNGNPVQLYQTGTKLANLGVITITEEGLNGTILPVPEDLERDPATVAFIDSIKAQYEDLLNTEVAYTPFDLTVNDPETGARIVRKQETNLGDLCADAYLNLFDVFGADIAFVNGGGVRANIAEGPITFGQILNVHPFGNSACLVEVTGQQILDALEMGSRNCPSENGGFLQVAGLTYEIHTYIEPNVVLGSDGMWTGNAGGEYRVKNVQVMNRETGAYEPLDLTKTYRLASHNYMLKNCGDGYGMFGVNNVTLLADEVMLDNAVLINYIQSMPSETIDGVEYEHVVTDEYADPYGQGRIVIVPEEPVVPTEPELIQGWYFETDPDEEGWTAEDDDGDGYNWMWLMYGVNYSYESAYEGYGLLSSASYGGASIGALSPDNWAISPSVTIPADGGTLTFYANAQDPSWADEHFAVYAGTTNDIYDMVCIFPETVTTGEYVQYTADLTAFAGQTIYIAFRHFNTYDMFRMNLDQVEVWTKGGETPPAGIAIHEVYVNGWGTPVAGVAGIDHMFLETPADAPYYIIYGGWRDETDQQQMWSEDHIFIAGHEYSEGCQIWAEDGYYFADDCVFYADGGQEILDMQWCYVDDVDNWICYMNTLPVVCEGESSGLWGDADGDGNVDANDALLVMRYALNLLPIGEAQLPFCDVSGDGVVNMQDALMILRYSLGLIPHFPVEEPVQ